MSEVHWYLSSRGRGGHHAVHLVAPGGGRYQAVYLLVRPVLQAHHPAEEQTVGCGLHVLGGLVVAHVLTATGAAHAHDDPDAHDDHEGRPQDDVHQAVRARLPGPHHLGGPGLRVVQTGVAPAAPLTLILLDGVHVGVLVSFTWWCKGTLKTNTRAVETLFDWGLV